jgi:hypothetical protein
MREFWVLNIQEQQRINYLIYSQLPCQADRMVETVILENVEETGRRSTSSNDTKRRQCCIPN